jgi:hypothetical protein
MCKAIFFGVSVGVFLFIMTFGTLSSPALAENNDDKKTVPMTAESTNSPASFLPSDPNSNLPPLEIESLQPITNADDMPVVNPYTNEIMDQETYQKMKQKEQGWWPKTYPILIDIAIGAGAGILACVIFLTIRKKRQEKMKSKTE